MSHDVHPIFGKTIFHQLAEIEPMLDHLEQLVRNCGPIRCRETFYRQHVRPLARMLVGPTRSRPDRIVDSAARLYTPQARSLVETHLRVWLPECDGHAHVPVQDANGHTVHRGVTVAATTGRKLGAVVAALEQPVGRPLVIYEDNQGRRRGVGADNVICLRPVVKL